MNAPENKSVTECDRLRQDDVSVDRQRSSLAATVIATLAVIGALWSGQRFLVPLAADLMLAMLVTLSTGLLGVWLHSGVAATVLTLAFVMGAFAAGFIAFGGQLVRVA